MKKGWVKLYRETLEKPIWKNASPEQCKIFITLLLMANYEKNKWRWEGTDFHCKPGQFITSAKSIMLEAGKGISRQNIRSALNSLEAQQFLTTKSTNTGLLITICNWDTYQNPDETTNQQINRQLTSNQPATNQQLTTIKELRNKNKENTPPISPLNGEVQNRFEIFWKAYPKKRGKGMAEKSFLKIKPSQELLDTMIVKIAEFKKCDDWKKKDGQFIPLPATWLNQKRWLDEVLIDGQQESLTIPDD